MKAILKLLGIVAVFIAILASWTVSNRPDIDKIREHKKDYHQSQISYPDDYAGLVAAEGQANRTFLFNEAAYCIVYDNNFPYSFSQLDLQTTKEIIRILNDTNSYRWGEFGSPEYSKTIIYYGDSENQIGYTLIEGMGEVENYPYRSLMKWGAMTDKGFEELMKQVNKK